MTFVAGMGADIGLVRDGAAIVAVHERARQFVIAETFEKRPTKGNPLKLSELCQDFATFMQRHGRKSALADHHCIEPAREWLGPLGCALDEAPGGNPGKLEVFGRFRELLTEGRIKIPTSQRTLIQQIRECMSKPLPGGLLKIWSPRRAGTHGDLLHAAALAIFDADRRTSVDHAYIGKVNRELMNKAPNRWSDFGGRGF